MTEEDRLNRLRLAMERHYASMEVWGNVIPALTNAEQHLIEWLGDKRTFLELDFLFGGIFGVADYAGSYGNYPDAQQVVMLAMVYTASHGFEANIGEICVIQLLDALDKAGFKPDLLELADLLFIQELLSIAKEAELHSATVMDSVLREVSKATDRKGKWITYREFVASLGAGSPMLPPPIPRRPMLEELRSRLDNLKAAMERQYADMDVSGHRITGTGIGHQELCSWLDRKQTFFDLDFSSSGLFGIAEWGWSCSDYPAAQRLAILGMVYGACGLKDSQNNHGIRCLALNIATPGVKLAGLEVADLLFLREALEVWRLAKLKNYIQPQPDLDFSLLVVNDELAERGDPANYAGLLKPTIP